MKKLICALFLFSMAALAQPPGGGGLPNVTTLVTPCQTTGTNVTVYKTTTTIGPYYCGADKVWHALTGGTVGAAFSAITGSTNTTAAMIVGSGASLSYTGTGIINASKILGATLTGINGIVKMTSGVPSAASAANVVSLFSSCTGTQYLGADEACHTVGAGTGDVVGPSSATDNAIARFDSTTGKLIQNSVVTISDAGAISTPSSLSVGVGGGPGLYNTTCGTAPGTPASDTVNFYCTSDVPSFKNDAGTVSVPVVPDTGASNNFLTAISAGGVISKAQPACASLSNGTALCSTTPGTNVATFLATPSSANLAAALTDETGTGVAVFNNGPTFIGPILGTPASGVATNLTGTASGLTAGDASKLGGVASATVLRRGISFSIGDPANSSALTTASRSATVTVPFACTISGYNLAFSPGDTGTITVKFWKVATGTAIPTVSDVINTSGVAIASGTAIHSTTVSDFTTTAVAANDMIAMAVTAVATTKSITAVLQCDQ